ncbi:MAG: UDP-3-O-(3-hydroxymyristoyl)glucosamine N-acyltransferase [Prevotella sp.]
MEFTAQQIAELVHGRVEGDADAKVSAFAKIEEGHEGAISFLANKKYQHYIYETKSSVVLVDDNLELEKEVKCTLIRVKSAYEAVAQLLQMYESMKPRKRGISELAFIDATASVGDGCYVGPFAYIGPGCVIGNNCVIHPNVCIEERAVVGDDTEIHSGAVIYHDCKVGNRCILHSGCVIGADGFGFAPSENGYDKIPQIGIVTIEDDVEIGANTCVDRSTMGSTFVRHGVKLDNLVQIAHNTDIGANTVMSSQVGVAGSTKVGEWCMFGGQVGVSGHITIGNKVMLGAQSGVPGSIKDGQQLIGTPPMEMRSYFKSQAIFRRLPEMYNEINRLRKELEEIKANK